MTEPQEPEVLSALPIELHSLKRYLLWKERSHETKPGKTRKVPFYANGRQRKGLLDTRADLDQLVTLEEAIDLYSLGGFDGVGFALAGDNVGAFDLDGILDDNQKLIKGHAGTELVHAARAKGAYIEVSPSGRGLRIVGPCSSTTAYSKDGLEYWGAKRFVTLTGEVWANPRGWVNLDDLREPLVRDRQAAEDDDDDGGPIITPKTISDLREALKWVDAEEYETWIRIGLALKQLGLKGRALWLEWSATSDKFNMGVATSKWDGFEPTSTGFKAVFAEAKRQGWKNTPTAKDDDLEEDEDNDSFAIPLGEMVLHPTEFILDGFLPVGVSVIAGAWGAGKSTNLIPIMASTAHLAPEEWGFWPTLRRKVIWITEAPEQARDTIFSLAKEKGSASWSEFGEWFRLFRAKRRPAKQLAKLIRTLIDGTTYTLDNGFTVNPVIVLDTTSANIDLENESDNSQVSQAMAILKQALPGISIILIGHTPKALAKADVTDMTFRGAGAWEADAVATYFLIHDRDTDLRFLAIRKCRFSPSFNEIDFDQAGGSLIVDTPWGEPQAKSYMHGVPRKSSAEERRRAQAEAQEEKKEEREERNTTERQTRILEFVRATIYRGDWPTKNLIREGVTGNKAMLMEALARLVDSGLVHEIDTAGLPRPEGMTGRMPPVTYLTPEIDPDLFFKRSPIGAEG
jgi:hypothetical protein